MADSEEGHRPTYEELQRKIFAATDPNNDIVFQIAVFQADEVVGAITQIRNARDVIAHRFDHPVQEHADVVRAEMEERLEKLDKIVWLMISDYARTIDRLLDCTCDHCKSAAAQWN